MNDIIDQIVEANLSAMDGISGDFHAFYRDERKGEVWRIYPDITRAKEGLGWRA